MILRARNKRRTRKLYQNAENTAPVSRVLMYTYDVSSLCARKEYQEMQERKTKKEIKVGAKYSLYTL